MKISHSKIGQNVNITDSGKTERAKSNNTSTKAADLESLSSNVGVNVNLSDRAQDAKRIKEIARATPDVDAAKVAKFRQMIEQGQYKVDSEAVADKMLKEYLDE